MLDRSTSPDKRVSTPVSERTDPARGQAADFAVVGIGASAGGLDACRKLLEALPAATGMAFILIQHLEPTHDSMMVELLASHTSMVVCQATDGMLLAPDHLYVIPPGAYLAVNGRALALSTPAMRPGTRLPFDFLLRSLAEACGQRAVCVVLSGTGSDGTLGVVAVRERGGFVLAQDPEEAAFAGMPRSAIMTCVVDRILPIASMPQALLGHVAGGSATNPDAGRDTDPAEPHLLAIIDLVRTRTRHNFTLYKPGTLRRRIERRMALAGIEGDGFRPYIAKLRDDAEELELLAKDLLINVTSFFRDPKVFTYLTEHLVPGLIRDHPADQPIRIWIVGCSTGEEAYSLAIIFREELAAAKSSLKLQVFASDVDPDAVAVAREGLYPETVAADMAPARLARFFSKEDRHYRVSPELRAAVVFTVQDILGDAPFSRLDFVSCRNLLIYLQPEAQAKIVSLFHFALCEGGVLLLGNSENVAASDDRFEVVSKAERVYRHVGRRRPGEAGFLIHGRDALPPPARQGPRAPQSRQAALADLCRRLALETYVTAAFLINSRNECVYTLGAADQFLHVPTGAPTQDLLALMRPELRIKLRSAIHQASRDKTRITIPGGNVQVGERALSFSIDVLPVAGDEHGLKLICFVEGPTQEQHASLPVAPHDAPRVLALERELDAVRTELQGAIGNLEFSNEEQKAFNEEVLSVQEEYQSTNEELLTSKEELQSLNEELTALNGQLQETLDRQRITSNDLQNVLYSTDVATVFLDANLSIRFFTPATKLLFNVLPSDIGRPLADLNFGATDDTLLRDATDVLQTQAPCEREIGARTGKWYMRRILPYRTQDHGVEGVVITFADITERRAVSDALRAATRQAESANTAKSRFLAAASHDLRQPLQTLTLLQGLMARAAASAEAQELVSRLDETLESMTSMLDTLLDINQIEAGTVCPVLTDFPVADLFSRMRDEFTYHAHQKGLSLHVVQSSVSIRSDARLLEQMVRNLISNALKYTDRGKVLLGCRCKGTSVRIEVWDSGSGIPAAELQAIFEEYHQLDNPARDRSRGLGLGLSIVQRLGALLGHHVRVRSRPGRGSDFAIAVSRSQTDAISAASVQPPADAPQAAAPHFLGTIMVIEDDAEIRDLLKLLLEDAGHHVLAARDAAAALHMAAPGSIRPDLILADYNLPGGMDGLTLTAALRQKFGAEIPAIILTGDISTDTLRDIQAMKCALLNKPVRLQALLKAIHPLLEPSLAPAAAMPNAAAAGPVIFIVDDDWQIRRTLRAVLEETGHAVEDFATCEAFLKDYSPRPNCCLLVDAYLPGMDGLELLQRLHVLGHDLPSIMITGESDVAVAVAAMKAGASDFIEKPVRRDSLLASIQLALDHTQDSGRQAASRTAAASCLAVLSPRQREVMDMVLAGHPSKNIAADLGISQRTVENHRASIMRRTGSKSLPALARLAVAASRGVADGRQAGAG